jgi:hypothetical protein
MAGSPYQLTREEVQAHLDQQMKFLETSAKHFDEGEIAEAKRMATHIRVLVHDTKSSKSLLRQLELKTTLFRDTRRRDLRDDPQLSKSPPLPKGCEVQTGQSYTVHSAYFGLVESAVGQHGPAFYAPLDKCVSHQLLPFDEWWDALVFNTDDGLSLTRRSLILTMADQDGGAHVDPELEAQYAAIAKQDGLGMLVGMCPSTGDGPPQVIPAGTLRVPQNPVEASVRQIAHEVLKTLKPDYAKQPPTGPCGGRTGEFAITLTAGKANNAAEKQKDKPPSTRKPIGPSNRVARNSPCPCGSGTKYKKCCGEIA